jgi:hypothetical protein
LGGEIPLVEMVGVCYILIPMAYLPRGIDPELLHSQVKNTMPYLFVPEAGDSALGRLVPAQILRAFQPNAAEPLSHLDYFKLCVSSHYLSCATPVPTDVDNQIRHKLWPAQLPLEVALAMADFGLESRSYDFTLLTGRFSFGASGTEWEKTPLSGHLGEWFTISAAAYCALKQYSDVAAHNKRQEILAQISDEVRRHSEIFGSLWRARDGLGSLKASASIAHNFGDLDRVMDMWNLAIEDPLRLGYYKLGVTPFDPNRKLRYQGRLWVAGELYKSVVEGSSMALENHRHFALRKPRCLRLSPEFMIPTAPFYDDWGRRVARGLADPDGKPTVSTLEVFEVLKTAWERQPKTFAYGRALRGFTEIHPEFPKEGLTQDPARKRLLEMSQERFEKRWNDEAVKQMDDIPSRA